MIDFAVVSADLRLYVLYAAVTRGELVVRVNWERLAKVPIYEI